MKKHNYKWDRLKLGVCYYPEHWNPELWREDLQRMQDTGIETIRIAEFAWNKFEPEEGVFIFDFFDSFLDIVKETGIRVIFGTPTATPPAWMSEKYPEILNCRRDGTPYRHGARRHYNYNSPIYQKFCSRIVDQLGRHYGSHPSIEGWQIDNELNCEVDEFYSEADTDAFRVFLKNRYGSLEALNEAWGTVFWNQTYTSWDQVYVPRNVIHDSVNPHQYLDYKRFISESAIRFCRMQSDILRKYVGEEVFITTNGMFGNLDNHKMQNTCLDVYTYDSYPNFANCLSEQPDPQSMRDRKWSRNLSEVRSICPNFGIMEQQSGANGWNTRMEAAAPKPGQIFLWTMQSVAHGADYISYFRWRTCTKGTEIYWHGILDYDNRDNRKLEEIRQIHRRVEKIQDVAGSSYKAEAAVVKDYSNCWDADVDVWHRRLEKQSEKELFAGFQLSHTPFDYLYLLEDTTVEELLTYKVLFYPHAAILNETKAKLLREYVRRGGCLILGCRTGYKDENGQCVMLPQPGPAADFAGTDVKDFTFLGPWDGTVDMEWNGRLYPVPLFHDIMEPVGPQAKVLGRFAGNYYEGKPALIENTFGRGRVLSLGAAFARETVCRLLEYTGIAEPYLNELELPEGCEIAVREQQEGKCAGTRYYFVLNYQSEPALIRIKRDMTDADTGETVCGELSLEPYGTKVYMVKQ